MEEVSPIELSFYAEPHQLCAESLNYEIRNKFEQVLYKGVYIQTIKSFVPLQYGKIMPNGSVQVSTTALCRVVNPRVNSTYEITVSSSNNMGAAYKTSGITVYIPKHMCTNQVVPNVDTVVNCEIVGKRIQDNILCIAKMV